MENRRLLEQIDYQNGTVTIGEKTYALRDKSFPTIDPAHPDELTEKEAEVLDKLIFAFRKQAKTAGARRFPAQKRKPSTASTMEICCTTAACR